MHKIGVLSDTHGLLRPEVLEALQGCEVILHGGDINKQSILDRLGEIAPVKVVRGNNDITWAEHIPETLRENVFGLNIFMIHNKKFIPKDLTGIDLVVYGHSHKYEDKVIEGRRFLNPGSCGPRRFHQEITLALLYVEEDSHAFRVEKILIPHPEAPKTGKPGSISAAGGERVPGGIPADIGEKVPGIMKDVSAGRSVSQIAAKYKLEEELAEQLVRMILTHPGVDVDGVLRRIGL